MVNDGEPTAFTRAGTILTVINTAKIDQLLEFQRSVITKRGKPYAEVVPVGSHAGKPRLAFLSLAGSGSGLWGSSSRETIKRLRDEWE